MRKLLSAVALLASCMAAQAIPVVPTSYSMPNGFLFLDEIYSGNGCRTCSGAALSGGLGELTDGVIALVNYGTNGAPYVGWNNTNATVTFNFNPGTAIDSVTISVDDNGGGSGVAPPSSVIINGTTYAVANPPGTAPFTFTVNNIGFVGAALPITFVRSGSWVMVSEVSFAAATAVPEVPQWGQLLAGSLGLGLVVLRRRQRFAGRN